MAKTNIAGAEALAVLTIAAVALLQAIARWVEHSVQGHRHLQDMLHALYKELMILGVVSFALFVFEASGLHIEKDDRHTFEIVHITLFLVAIAYFLFVLLLVAFSS